MNKIENNKDYTIQKFDSIDDKDTAIEYSIDRITSLTQRYIEAEEFIMNLKWYEKLFISKKIKTFFRTRLEKYGY
jgi:hypothetical protein